MTQHLKMPASTVPSSKGRTASASSSLGIGWSSACSIADGHRNRIAHGNEITVFSVLKHFAAARSDNPWKPACTRTSWLRPAHSAAPPHGKTAQIHPPSRNTSAGSQHSPAGSRRPINPVHRSKPAVRPLKARHPESSAASTLFCVKHVSWHGSNPQNPSTLPSCRRKPATVIFIDKPIMIHRLPAFACGTTIVVTRCCIHTHGAVN